MDVTIKSTRTLLRLNIAAQATNKILGHNDAILCRHCKAYQASGLHWSDCTLFKVHPVMLSDAKILEKVKSRKNANRQIMFKNDDRYTESKQRVNRKMATRPKRKFTTLYPKEDV